MNRCRIASEPSSGASARRFRGVIGAPGSAPIELRDRGEINDQTLQAIERDLDLEELRMEV